MIELLAWSEFLAFGTDTLVIVDVILPALLLSGEITSALKGSIVLKRHVIFIEEDEMGVGEHVWSFIDLKKKD